MNDWKLVPVEAKFSLVQTDTAGNVHVAIFDAQRTAAIEHYVIPNPLDAPAGATP